MIGSNRDKKPDRPLSNIGRQTPCDNSLPQSLTKNERILTKNESIATAMKT